MASTNFLNDNQEGLRHWETPPGVAQRVRKLRAAQELLGLPNLVLTEAVRATEQPQPAMAAHIAEITSQPDADELNVVNIPSGQSEPVVVEVNTAIYGQPLDPDAIRRTFNDIYGGSQN